MRTRGFFALASLLTTASIIASGRPRRIGAIDGAFGLGYDALDNRIVSREARGFWPDDRPATWRCRQGAKASPETGTIRLMRSNQGRVSPPP